MNDIRVEGTMTAVAGIERAHLTEREYPFTLHPLDSLKLPDGRVIHITEEVTFHSREEQDKFAESR